MQEEDKTCLSRRPLQNETIDPHPKCLEPNCEINASFALAGTVCPLFCVKHIPAGEESSYFNTHCQMCQFPECPKVAKFGHKDIREWEFCATHGRPQPDYIPLEGLCQKDNCVTYASFGLRGGTEKEFCSVHEPQDGTYVNLRAVLCRTEGCPITATYGVEGTTKQLHCKVHAAPGMVNLYKATCQYPECKISPSYAPSRDEAAQLCTEHAKGLGFVNVKSRICEGKDVQDGQEIPCPKTASYGPPESRKSQDRKFCKRHAPADWINVSHHFCEEITNEVQCNRAATCGYLFAKVHYCLTHKKPNMWRNNKPKCEVAECIEQPLYTSRKSSYPLRCPTHKHDGDKDVVLKECVNCHLSWYIREGLDKCDYCRMDADPHWTHRYELDICDYLKQCGFEFTHDVTLNNLSRKRPDCRVHPKYPENNHRNIVEIDEDHHDGRSCFCEQSRMIELFQAFCGLRVTFIRINPYPFAYKVKGEWQCATNNARKKRLVNVLTTLESNPPKEDLTVIYLFYPEDTGKDELIVLDYKSHLTAAYNLATVDLGLSFQAESKEESKEEKKEESKEEKKETEAEVVPTKLCSGSTHDKPIELPLSSFGRDAATSDGYRQMCKECRKPIQQKAQRAATLRAKTGTKHKKKTEPDEEGKIQCSHRGCNNRFIRTSFSKGGFSTRCPKCNSALQAEQYSRRKARKLAESASDNQTDGSPSPGQENTKRQRVN